MNYRIIREDSDNELQHAKYIRRERGKNGKWVYYYDKDQLKKDAKHKLKEIGQNLYEGYKGYMPPQMINKNLTDSQRNAKKRKEEMRKIIEGYYNKNKERITAYDRGYSRSKSLVEKDRQMINEFKNHDEYKKQKKTRR